jgi:hypothetical protein
MALILPDEIISYLAEGTPVRYGLVRLKGSILFYLGQPSTPPEVGGGLSSLLGILRLVYFTHLSSTPASLPYTDGLCTR